MGIMKLSTTLFEKVRESNPDVRIKVIGNNGSEITFDIRLSKDQLVDAFLVGPSGEMDFILAVDGDGKFEFLWKNDMDDEEPYSVNQYTLTFNADGNIVAECAPMPIKHWVTLFEEL